jgi:hypothetical protein
MLPRHELVSVGSSAWFGEVFMSVRLLIRDGPEHEAGNSNAARNSARIDSTHTPISRSGKDKSQTIGAATNASNAMGQLNAKRTHHAMKSSNSFMASARNRVKILYQRRTQNSATRPDHGLRRWQCGESLTDHTSRPDWAALAEVSGVRLTWA